MRNPPMKSRHRLGCLEEKEKKILSLVLVNIIIEEPNKNDEV